MLIDRPAKTFSFNGKFRLFEHEEVAYKILKNQTHCLRIREYIAKEKAATARLRHQRFMN
jgi:hypothetical protein